MESYVRLNGEIGDNQIDRRIAGKLPKRFTSSLRTIHHEDVRRRRWPPCYCRERITLFNKRQHLRGGEEHGQRRALPDTSIDAHATARLLGDAGFRILGPQRIPVPIQGRSPFPTPWLRKRARRYGGAHRR